MVAADEDARAVTMMSEPTQLGCASLHAARIASVSAAGAQAIA